MAGEQVIYAITKDTFEAKSTYVGKLQKVTTEEAEDAKNLDIEAEYATFERDAELTWSGEALTDKSVKIPNTSHYFADDVKFIYITGSKSNLEVQVKTGAQKVTVAYEYVVEAIEDSTNSLVKYVIVETIEDEETVYTGDVVFAIEENDSKKQVATYVDPETEETEIAYEHTAYVNGVKTALVTTSKTKLVGFYKMTEIAEGIYETEQLTQADGVYAETVTNMYNGLITAGDFEDVNVKGVTVVDLTDADEAVTDATKLTKGYEIAFVVNEDDEITMIYVIGEPA